MKRFVLAMSMTAIAVAVCASTAWGQRGVGNSTGVARLADRPQVVELVGTLEAIHIGPCEHTTGQSPVGVHIMLAQDMDKKLNVHLGPAGAVQPLIGHLKTGDKLTIEAFRTDALPADQYIAKSISTDGKIVTLRDATLRPFWAGGRGGDAGRGPRGRGWGGNGAFDGPGLRGPRGWNAFADSRNLADSPVAESSAKAGAAVQDETDKQSQSPDEPWRGCRYGRGGGCGRGFGPGPGPGRGPRW